MKKLFLYTVLLFFTSVLSAQIDSLSLQTIVQMGHLKPINCSAVTTDGKYLLTGSKDNVVKLWDVDLGFEIRSFYRHTEEVLDVNFNQDGSLIVSVGKDNKVYVHNVLSGKLIQQFSIEAGQVWQAFFSRDSEKVITSATRGSLCVWNIKSGKRLHQFSKSYSGDINESWQGFKSMLIPNIKNREELQIVNFNTNDTILKISMEKEYDYSFSPDDKMLAVGSTKLLTHIIDIETSKVVKTLKSDTINRCDGCNTRVLFSHTGKYLASGSKSNGLSIWNGKNFKKIKTYEVIENINEMEFSADDNYLMISYNRALEVIDIKTGNTVYKYENLFSTQFKPHFIHGKKQIIIPTEFNTVSIVNFSTGKIFRKFEGYINRDAKDGLGLNYASRFNTGILYNISMKTSVAVSPDDRWIAKGNVDSTVFIVDLKTGVVKKKLQGHSSLVYKMKFTKDGKVLATGGGDRFIILWDTETWKEIGRLKGHVEKVFDFDFSQDGKKLISAAWDGYLISWDLEELKTKHYTSFEKTSAYTVRFANNDLYTIHGDLSSDIFISEFDSKETYKELIGHTSIVSGICFGTNVRDIYTSSWDGTVRGWDLGSGMLQMKHKSHRGAVYSINHVKSKNWLLSGGADNEIVIWDISSNKEIDRLKGHKNPVTSIQITSDEAYVVSTSADGEVKVWDLTSKKELYTYLQINQDDWLVTNPQGYFDGSVNALKLVTYVKGLQVVPISSLFKKYYTPNLSKRIMSGETFVSNENEFGDIPEVSIAISSAKNVIIKSDSGIQSKGHYIDYDITSKSLEADVMTVQVFKNDKLVKQLIMSKGKSATEKSVSIYLHNGVNDLKFVATNSNGVESVPVSESIWYNGEQGKTDLFILAIGINDYKKESYKLNYAVHDAQAFLKNLNNGVSDSLFHEVNSVLIKNSHATKENIIVHLNSIAKEIGPEDVFVFFYAGHGVMSEGMEESEFYLVLNDIINMYGDNQELEEKGLAGKELVEISKDIAAEKQLFVLDACQSGGALHAFASRGFGREKALAQLARSTGTFFLTASQDAQLANESNELKHGVFTYSLLEVLKGNDEASAKDEKITVGELKTYAEERVPELSKKYQGYVQYPTSYGFGQDFPLVILKK